MHGFLLQITALGGPRRKTSCIVKNFTHGYELRSQGGMKIHPSLDHLNRKQKATNDLDARLVLMRRPRPSPLAEERVIILQSRGRSGCFPRSGNMSVDVNWFFDTLTRIYIIHARSTGTIYIRSHLHKIVKCAIENPKTDLLSNGFRPCKKI